ncbi:MAG: AsmA family protein [Pseudomonadota bacterium]
MRRLFKILMYLVILVAVLLGGAAAAWLYAPSATIAGIAEAQVEEATGRKLTIDGAVERRLFPVIGVKIHDVTLANADWAESGPLATAASADVGVRFLPLLTGALEIEKIEIEQPEVIIEIAEDGRRSWEMEGFDVDSGAAADFEEQTGLPEPSDIGEGGGDDVVVVFDRFAITRGSVTVIDRRAGGAADPIAIADIELEGALPSLDETLTLTGSAVAQGRPARLGVTLESPAALARGDLAKAKADLSAEGVAFDFDGAFRQGGAAPEAEGALSFTLDEDPARSAWIRALLPESLDPLGGVDVNGSFTAAETGVDATMTGDVGFREQATAFTATAKAGEGWAAGGAPVTLALDASNPLFEAGWDGSVSAGDASLNGDLRFASTALRDFFEWLGLGPVEAPAGAFERVDISARLDADPMQGALTALDLTLDESAVTGEMSYDLTGERPAVAATLRSGPLDIRPFVAMAGQGAPAEGGGAGAAPAASGGSSGGASGGGWSKEPLDLGALQLVDAKIDVLTEGLATPVVTLNRTHVVADLTDGRLQTDVREMALYGGAVTGEAIIDGSTGTPSMSTSLDASGVALRPLLRDSAEMDWLEGTGAMKLVVVGRGESLDAMMRSLNGTGSIDFRDGAIIGVNLAALARNIGTLGLGGGGEEQKTDFAELTASFFIEDGVANNEDLFLSGPLLRLTGAGAVDIGAQTVNYRAVPRAVASLTGQGGDRDSAGIAFPLLITGPWADPSITPDLTGGALDSLEDLLTNPDAAGALIEQIGGEGGVGDILEGGGLGDALEGLTGGGSSEEGGGGLGDALEGLTGGGEEEEGGGDLGDAIRGLF